MDFTDSDRVAEVCPSACSALGVNPSRCWSSPSPPDPPDLAGQCNPTWCTSPGVGLIGFDCFAGFLSEGCTCSSGSARLTGNNAIDPATGIQVYEYNCCTNGTFDGEFCGDHTGPPPQCDTACSLFELPILGPTCASLASFFSTEAPIGCAAHCSVEYRTYFAWLLQLSDCIAPDGSVIARPVPSPEPSTEPSPSPSQLPDCDFNALFAVIATLSPSCQTSLGGALASGAAFDAATQCSCLLEVPESVAATFVWYGPPSNYTLESHCMSIASRPRANYSFFF